MMKKIGFAGVLMLLLVSLAYAGTSGPSPIPTPPSFTVTSTALNLCKGVVNYIPIVVVNNAYPGTNAIAPTMTNIELSLVSTKGLSPAGNGTASTPALKPNRNATAILPVFVNANASEFISTGVDINYYFDQLYSDSEQRNFSVTTQQCPMPLAVSISPYILTAGTIQNITVTLNNTSPMSLNSIEVQLKVPNTGGAFLTRQPVQIASIPPMNTVRFNETLYLTENTSEAVTLNTTVSYYNGSQLQQIYATLPLLSSGIIDLTPSEFASSPSIVSPSSVFSESFVLTDTGTAGATAVMVTPIPPKGFTTYGSNSSFVGSIGVDTQTPVTVSFITSNSVKPGKYLIPIRVNYINNLRDNITTWANASVVVAGSSAFNGTAGGARVVRSSSGGGGGVLIILLLLAVVVLGYLYYRERKRRAK